MAPSMMLCAFSLFLHWINKSGRPDVVHPLTTQLSRAGVSRHLVPPIDEAVETITGRMALLMEVDSGWLELLGG